LLSRFLRDDHALVTIEWSVVAGFLSVVCVLQSGQLAEIADRALDQFRAALRTLAD
jgi:Flp pilus assembly pilin Flp